MPVPPVPVTVIVQPLKPDPTSVTVTVVGVGDATVTFPGHAPTYWEPESVPTCVVKLVVPDCERVIVATCPVAANAIAPPLVTVPPVVVTAAPEAPNGAVPAQLAVSGAMPVEGGTLPEDPPQPTPAAHIKNATDDLLRCFMLGPHFPDYVNTLCRTSVMCARRLGLIDIPGSAESKTRERLGRGRTNAR